MDIIGPILLLILIGVGIKALAETVKGSFLMILMPFILILINFTIGWENYWQGIPVPNPFDPGGFINEIIARFIGGTIDSWFGITFFRPAFSWLLGMGFYSFILAGFHVVFYNIFLKNLNRNISFVVFAGWLVFFTCFYYFHLLDNFFVFGWFSMPFKAGNDIKWYYWISIVWSAYIVWDQNKGRY